VKIRSPDDGPRIVLFEKELPETGFFEHVRIHFVN